MKMVLIVLSLIGASASASRGEDYDRNKFDFYRLRASTEKYQRGEASLDEVRQALAALRTDGYSNVIAPEKLTAENAKSMTVLAEDTCGVVRIFGPGGMVTGFGIQYSSASGRDAALATASHHCVSGFKPVAVPTATSK